MNMRTTLQLPDARRSIEDRIERLLALLDEIDGDADFEPVGDAEPSLGWPLYGPSALASNRQEDRELDDCDDEDSHDREIDDGETDSHNWSDDPDAPQLGERWCFVAGA